MKSALALVAILFPLSSWSSEIKVHEGSCGALGCGSVTTSSAQVLSAALLDQDVAKLIGTGQIVSIKRHGNWIVERYELRTTSRKICITVEYTELPIVIDGKPTVEVGDLNILVSAKAGKCN